MLGCSPVRASKTSPVQRPSWAASRAWLGSTVASRDADRAFRLVRIQRHPHRYVASFVAPMGAPLSHRYVASFAAPMRGLLRCIGAGTLSLHQCGASSVAQVEPSHARLLSGPCIKNLAGAETILGRQPSMARLYRCLTGRRPRLPPCPHPATPAPVRGLFRCTNGGLLRCIGAGLLSLPRVEPSHARLLSGPCIKNPAGAETILGRQPSMARLYRCLTGRRPRLPPCPHPPTPAPVRGLFRCTNGAPLSHR